MRYILNFPEDQIDLNQDTIIPGVLVLLLWDRGLKFQWAITNRVSKKHIWVLPIYKTIENDEIEIVRKTHRSYKNPKKELDLGVTAFENEYKAREFLYCCQLIHSLIQGLIIGPYSGRHNDCELANNLSIDLLIDFHESLGIRKPKRKSVKIPKMPTKITGYEASNDPYLFIKK